MNFEKALNQFETPLLGHTDNKGKKIECDTGSDCPYTRLNDETVDNFESQAGDLNDTQITKGDGVNGDFMQGSPKH